MTSLLFMMCIYTHLIKSWSRNMGPLGKNKGRERGNGDRWIMQKTRLPLPCDLAFTKKQGAFPAFSRKNTLLRPTIISCPVQSAKAIARKEILSLDCSPCRHLLSNRPRLRSSGRQPVHSPQPITSKNHPPFHHPPYALPTPQRGL